MSGRPAPPWLVATHIASSVAVLGGDAVLLVLGVSGQAGTDPRTIYPAMALVARYVILPLAALALGTGLVLATAGRRRLLGQAWATIKLAITTVLTALVVLVVIPGLGEAADSATGLAAATLLSESVRVTYAVVPAVTLSLLLLNVALAVYKPRRLRGTRFTGYTTGSSSPVSTL